MKSPAALLRNVNSLDLGLFFIASVYAALGYTTIYFSLGSLDIISISSYLKSLLAFLVMFSTGYFFYLGFRIAYILIFPNGKPPEEAAWDDLKSGVLNREAYKRVLPVILSLAFFFATFFRLKILIPEINPFSWDQTFAEFDKSLHFGMDPWRVLAVFFRHPAITSTISVIYLLWIPSFLMVIYWQLFRFHNDLLRMRFFYTFMLSWVINGSFFALVFSSAGPCFAQKIMGFDYFQPLMAQLESSDRIMPVLALGTQEWLLNNYSAKGYLAGGGISAFPSVHVATAFLFVLMARHVNRPAFIFFLIFFVFILVGSVHLGWHYAVDGYFSILTTWGIWLLSGYASDK